MRLPITALVLTVGAGVAVAIGCGGAPPHVDPWIPPMPSCSCAEPVASTPCTAPVASASAAPSASASAPVYGTEKRVLQGTVNGPTGKPLANAVVYIEDAPKVAGRGETAMVDQRNMQFSPYLVTITTGGTVTFVNSDPFPHNVFIRDNGEKFDTGMVSAKSSRQHAFKNPGAYKVLCNLHPNMLAYIFVAPSSYFGMTNGQGKFTIKDVPEGNWKVTTWANGLSLETEQVKVVGGDATVTLALHTK